MRIPFSVTNGPSDFRNWWHSRNQRQRLTILGGIALVLAASLGIGEAVSHTSYAVVYSGLSPQTGGSVIAALQKGGIPFRLLDNGNVIEVPKADAARVRLQLAEQGLPAQATSALWHQLQNEKLGTSSFVEHTTYIRALEAGLSKDIESIQGVEAATVNLAIPNRTPFLERMPSPKAAVTLKLAPGMMLTQEQVYGITHLVASSVPGLKAGSVTVVDQYGRALTAKPTGSQSSAILRLQQRVESAYRKQIVDLLAPIVGGKRNLRVAVDANIDLSHTQKSFVTYGMGHVVTAAVESSRTKGSASSSTFGIPGALSNQPPGNPQAPITAPATSAAPGLTLQEIRAMIPRSSQANQRFHYVLDKTVGFTKGEPWRLTSLSVSVLINGKSISPTSAVSAKPVSASTVSGVSAATTSAVRPASKRRTLAGIPEYGPKTLLQLKRMVTNTIHASAPQGTVVLSVLPYERPAPIPHLPWWRRISPWVVWSRLEWFLLGLIALLLFRKLAVEFMKQRKTISSQQPSSDASSSGEDAPDKGRSNVPPVQNVSPSIPLDHATLDLNGVSQASLEENLNTIKELIRSDTVRAVEVIREWIGNLGEVDGNG
ncbi:flagellar basal-body MS-ring/collar protein FliF [Acidithiobacillus caldus]